MFFLFFFADYLLGGRLRTCASPRPPRQVQPGRVALLRRAGQFRLRQVDAGQMFQTRSGLQPQLQHHPRQDERRAEDVRHRSDHEMHSRSQGILQSDEASIIEELNNEYLKNKIWILKYLLILRCHFRTKIKEKTEKYRNSQFVFMKAVKYLNFVKELLKKELNFEMCKDQHSVNDERKKKPTITIKIVYEFCLKNFLALCV